MSEVIICTRCNVKCVDTGTCHLCPLCFQDYTSFNQLQDIMRTYQILGEDKAKVIVADRIAQECDILRLFIERKEHFEVIDELMQLSTSTTMLGTLGSAGQLIKKMAG